MDEYSGRPSYITITNFDKVNVRFPRHQKFDDVADASVEIVHVKDDRFLYPSGAHADKNDRIINAVHYELTIDHLHKMAEHEVVKDRYKETLKKKWLVDI